MLAAMFCFSSMNILIRVAAHDLHSTQIVFLRNFFSLLLFLPWITKMGISAIKTSRMQGHFWRSALGITSMQMWFYALSSMNLAQATALSFTTPIFVVIIAILFLKEKATLWQIAGIGTGFAGTVVIIQPWLGGLDPLVILVLSSAIIMAVVSVLVKTLTSTEKSLVIVFYMALFMTPLSLPPALVFWKPVSLQMVLVIFGVALFSTVAHYLLTMAYRHADMVILMPIDFVRLLFTSVMAYFLFDQTLGWPTLIGAALIIAGVVIGSGVREKWMQNRAEYVERIDPKE